MPSPLKQSRHLWFLVAALLFAMFLAINAMDADFLWWDEWQSTRIAGTGINGPLITPAEIWQLAVEDPYHPPLYFIALAGWNALFGGTQFALRLFSLLTGLLMLAWMYRLGVWFGGRALGVAALLIMSGSAFMLGYFPEMRSYILHALFGISTAALYWRIINGKPSAGLYVAFTLSVAGLLYTHYFAFLFGAALGVYHLLWVRKDAVWVRLILCAVGGLILFFPWLTVVLTAVTNVTGDPRFSVLNIGELLRLTVDGLSNGVVPFLAVLLIGGAVALRFPAGRFAVWMGAFIFASAIVLNHFVPMLTHLRYIITLWGFAVVVAGYGAMWLARQPRYGLPLAAFLLVTWWGAGSLAMLTPDFQNRMFRDEFLPIFRPTLPLYPAMQTIQADLQAHDVVLYDSPLAPWAVGGGFDYYAQTWGVPHALLSGLAGDDVSGLAQSLTDYTGPAQRVWFITETHPPDFRQQALAQVVDASLTHCETTYVAPELRVDVYSKYARCCTRPTGEVARYAEGIVLHGLDVMETDADALTLLAHWSVSDAVPEMKYSVGFYVLDADGSVMTQIDAGLQIYASSCQLFSLPREALPAGEHTIYMSVYAWDDLTRLTGVADGVTGDLLPVARIRID